MRAAFKEALAAAAKQAAAVASDAATKAASAAANAATAAGNSIANNVAEFMENHTDAGKGADDFPVSTGRLLSFACVNPWKASRFLHVLAFIFAAAQACSLFVYLSKTLDLSPSQSPLRRRMVSSSCPRPARRL